MLTVKDVSRLLSRPENRIYDWIRKGDIPVYKLGEEYRFNRVELLEWATQKKIPVALNIFNDNRGDGGERMPSLPEVLATGGIHFNVAGTDTESVIRALVEVTNFPENMDRKFIAEALLARENLGTTAIGNGIAIPHVRNPIISHVTRPIMSLCFLEHPADFNALDDKPIDTVFTIITHNIRSHLYLLSRLSFALHKPEVRRVITRTSGPDLILRTLSRFEETLSGGSV